MEKVFLYTDKSNINSKIAHVKTALSEFAPFYKRYKDLELEEMKPEDLQAFLHTPKTFFLNLLTGGETLTVGTLKLDPEKVYDLSPRPSGVDELVNDILIKIKQLSINGNYLGERKNITILNNELVVDPVYVDSLKKQFTYHTGSDDQIKALHLVEKISKNLNELRTLRKQPMYGDDTFVEQIFGGWNGAAFKPNLKTILGF